MTNYAPVIKTLKARLQELTKRITIIENDLRLPLNADSAEQALDLADGEALAALDDAGRKEIAQINAALARIKGGTYGICARCGDPIESKRLKVLPTATRCIKCA